jgi:hypothetical protein
MKTTTVTVSNGGLARWMTISTVVEPSQRTVVLSPIRGRPSCIHRMTAEPLRTFQKVPAANQPTTRRAPSVKTVIIRGLPGRRARSRRGLPDGAPAGTGLRPVC